MPPNVNCNVTAGWLRGGLTMITHSAGLRSLPTSALKMSFLWLLLSSTASQPIARTDARWAVTNPLISNGYPGVMYTWTVEWPCPAGSTLVYSGQRPTREAALRARIEKIRQLSVRYPKHRTVQVRGD